MHFSTSYLCIVAATVASTFSFIPTTMVEAHGYLSYPPARANSGNPYAGKALCRGESPKQPTSIPSKVDLKFHITAGHPGTCMVFVLDEHLKNPVKVGEKADCAKTKAPQPWRVDLSRFEGRKMVLRFVWHAVNKGKKEFYENCSDIVVKKKNGGAPKRPSPAKEESSVEEEDENNANASSQNNKRQNEGGNRRSAPKQPQKQQQQQQPRRQQADPEESSDVNQKAAPRKVDRRQAVKKNTAASEETEVVAAPKGEKSTEKREEEDAVEDVSTLMK